MPGLFAPLAHHGGEQGAPCTREARRVGRGDPGRGRIPNTSTAPSLVTRFPKIGEGNCPNRKY
ncbi:MAG: hypothetical protein AVDCRST_MAG12-524 [uncultured Rubrobacteraceae bacterium]|uniref:Uncharacterized protein n=1 Tax=uncultured Rubrobacteraceae bacterium TaxID=349277 RepID=A0A6J4R9W8_9ACTN|nr:MAG: hypothetical protein AVDCRST_MAG12-524 [uncultured Rubrobacteraceae bacterium]